MRLRVVFSVLAVLSLVGASGTARPQATAAGASGAEQALRQLADRFFHSMESTDFTEFLSLWSARAPDDLSKLRRAELVAPAGFGSGAIGLSSAGAPRFAYDAEKVHVDRLAIRRVEVSRDTAKVHVKVSIRAVSKSTQMPITSTGIGAFMGEDHFLTLRCVREAGVWKVLEPVGTEADLASLVAQAGAEDARTALLTENQDLMPGLFASALEQEAQNVFYFANNEKAMVLERLAIDIAERFGTSRSVADLLNKLANRYNAQGDLAHALQYYRKSLDQYDLLGREGRGPGNLVRGNIGELYAQQGKYSQAVEWYQATTDWNNLENLIPDSVWGAAEAHEKLGNYDQAMDSLNGMLLLSEQWPRTGDRDALVARTLVAIGECHAVQGHYVQALDSFAKAQPLMSGLADMFPLNASHQQGMSTLLTDMARVYLKQGENKLAVESIDRAMAIQARFNNSLSGAPEVLLTAGRAYLAAGRHDKARKLLDQTIDASEYRRSHAAGGAENRERYFESLVAPYRDMISLLIAEKDTTRAFGYAERSKARTLLDALDTSKVEINKGMTTGENARELEFRRQLAALNQKRLSAVQEETPDLIQIRQLDDDLAKARQAFEAFQDRLYVSHPELRTTRGEMKPITLAETKTLLPDSATALLEYAVTDERTYLFVITNANRQSPPVLHVYSIEIREKELQARVERYREQIAHLDLAIQQPARDLFKLLLGPAQADFKDASTLIIVPDGVLWDLPFQALYSERGWLNDTHTIYFEPSLTAMQAIENSRATAKTGANRLDLLAFGNPDIGKQTRARVETGLMSENLEPLPEAEKQVNKLQAVYGSASSRVYTAARATEARAKAEAPNARVIQFATHGILDSANPMYSHLVLSQSGNDVDEDGLLETWEIMRMNLHADMVVLAACETARGRIGAGEGIVGMSWAFFVAGSPTTVASQWKVAEASTTQLMQAFHENLQRSAKNPAARLSKAQALTSAARTVRQNTKYQHPFYWAPFVLIGDGS